MTDLQIYLAGLAKMWWLWLPITLLFAGWILNDAINEKWKGRFEKIE